MVSKDWLELAQIASSVVAACGLCATAWQMHRTRRASDLQALQKFFDDANEREAALAEAQTDAARGHAFIEFMNFLEMYACAYNKRLIIGRGVREMVRHKIQDSCIELQKSPGWHPEIERANDRSTTFIELRSFVRRYKAEISRRSIDCS